MQTMLVLCVEVRLSPKVTDSNTRAVPARAHRLPPRRRSVVRVARSERRRGSCEPDRRSVLREGPSRSAKLLQKEARQVRGGDRLRQARDRDARGLPSEPPRLHAAHRTARASVPASDGSGAGRGLLS